MALTIKKPKPIVVAPAAPAFKYMPELVKFQPMLAASEIPKESQVRFPILASFKYDGIRAPQTGGRSMSRKMIPTPNLFIQAWSMEFAARLHGFDGELIVGPPNLETTFNTSTSGINSRDGEPDFMFYAFEHWNLEDMPALRRQGALELSVRYMPDELRKRIVLVEQRLIKNIHELKEFYALALSLGYEGLILKDPNGVYKFGRSTILGGQALKWKEFDFIKCEVISVKQGMKNTNEKKVDEVGKAKRSSAKAGKVPVEEAGGYVVKCIDDTSTYLGKTFSVGPGNQTDVDLRNAWKDRALLPGAWMRVKVQRAGAVDLPRFPGFNAWVSPNDSGTVCN